MVLSRSGPKKPQADGEMVSFSSTGSALGSMCLVQVGLEPSATGVWELTGLSGLPNQRVATGYERPATPS